MHANNVLGTSQWSKLILIISSQQHFNMQDKSRLLVVKFAHSSDWMNTLPTASCSLFIENKVIHVVVDSCLGVVLCKSTSVSLRSFSKGEGSSWSVVQI